jgi:hypothetical protein
MVFMEINGRGGFETTIDPIGSINLIDFLLGGEAGVNDDRIGARGNGVYFDVGGITDRVSSRLPSVHLFQLFLR